MFFRNRETFSSLKPIDIKAIVESVVTKKNASILAVVTLMGLGGFFVASQSSTEQKPQNPIVSPDDQISQGIQHISNFIQSKREEVKPIENAFKEVQLIPYQVKDGDWLYKIVRTEYGVTEPQKIDQIVKLICQVNGISTKQVLRVGQLLRLPPKEEVMKVLTEYRYQRLRFTLKPGQDVRALFKEAVRFGYKGSFEKFSAQFQRINSGRSSYDVVLPNSDDAQFFRQLLTFGTS